MKRFSRMLVVGVMLSLAMPLANCSNGSFDPTSALDDFFSGQKKPLPGDRKPLFPEGTPGIQRGVPPDLVKGYQPPSEAAASETPAAPKAKAQAKSKSAAAPAPQAAPSQQ
jgi:hypothetical protein